MVLSELIQQLDPKTSEALQAAIDELRSEFRQQLERTRRELAGEEASAEESVAAEAAVEEPVAAEAVEEPVAEAVAEEAASDPLEELKHAVARIDRATSQAEILNALLQGARRFSSRTAIFLVRPEGLEGWDGLGFEGAAGAVERLEIGLEPGSAWTRLTEGLGGVPLSPAECSTLCDPLGAEPPLVGVLVPLMLGGQVAAALYGDREEGDGSLNLTALQLLTFNAGQVLETLPVRNRTTTSTLRLAGDREEPAAPEPELATAVAEEPAVIAEEPEAAPDVAQEPEAAVPTEEPLPMEPEAAAPGLDTTLLPTLSELELGAPAVEDLEVIGTEAAPPAEEAAPPTEAPPLAETPPFTETAPPAEAPPPVSEAPPPAEAPTPVSEAPPVESEAPPPVSEAPPPVSEAPPPPEAVAEPRQADLGKTSTLIQPPEDVEGPGWAFTGSGISERGDEAKHEEARRLARLLVTEIKLYNEDQVELGRQQRDIEERLREDIDRSRQIFEDRVDREVREERDYFREALVRILAGGDEGAMGS